ncbi:MAG TPA: long-chain fatty acid--CoA ligase [Candidatus Acidoferrales bacterium]|nr:long-chain fatty acid--CoA ligase [Candidatus Acidoferrales bacterium]
MIDASAIQQLNTLVDVLYAIVGRQQENVMLYEQDGSWRNISSSDLYRRVAGVANALRRWGVGRGDRIAILSENRPEWSITDFATLMLGAVTVPIYSTLTAEQCAFHVSHSGARIIFVSTETQRRKIEQLANDVPVDRVIMMDEPGPASHNGRFVLESMRELMQSGPTQRDPELDAIAHSVRSNDLATIIYTSGTTGTPKGAMLSHGNLASNMQYSTRDLSFVEGDISVSFLPLSHITARHVDFAQLCAGVTLAYCPVIEDLPRVMKEIRPTIFIAVPRVYEKIYNGVQRQIGTTGAKRKIYRWALHVGELNVNTVLSLKRPRTLSWKLADKFVFSKVMQSMGGRVRIFISGGAPLGRELAEWYAKIGIVIHEGYGLTETSPVIALSTPLAHKLGSVGRPLPNIQVRIAEDGELLVRGPSVFCGYWNMPQETANAFENGWFKTGDIAHLDADGFLSITDRKKDLIKTSGGKFIAPQPIENSLKANPLVSEAAVVGERRRFPAVVIAPSFAVLEQWATDNGVLYASREQLVQHTRVQALYSGIVEDVNSNLAKYEKLKKVLLLPEELSIENGLLTPTMKLRRRNVEARYRMQIEQLYADSTLPAESSAAS